MKKKSSTSTTTSTNSASSNSSIKKILSADPLPQSILILCTDNTRRERALTAILEKFIKDEKLNKEERKSAITTIDSSTITIDSLVQLKENISTLSLFSSSRIFILKETEKLSVKVTDQILDICAATTEKNLIILIGTKLPAISKLLKWFIKSEQAMIIEEPSSEDALKWAQKEAASIGLNCLPAIVNALVIISENEATISEQPVIDLISAKLNRLALYLDGDAASLSDIENLFPDSSIASEYDFVDQGILGNLAKSEPLLSTLLQNGKNPFLLLSLFSRSLTNVLLVRFMMERGKTQEEIRSQLNINPWVLKKVIPLAKAVPASKLLRAAVEILKLDNRLKGASLDEVHLFSSMLGSLAR